MTNLRIPDGYTTRYPIRQYPVMGNLLRITEYNRSQMDDWILRTGYNLNNKHPLVNLLQLLGIDSSWTLNDLVTIVRYKMNSVCSLCNITNFNRNARALHNVFYKDTKEVLFAVYNDKTYEEENLSITSLNPVIPTYINTYGVNYNASIERTSNSYTERGQVAFIGIDVVDLAVGWWLYMRDHTGQGTGIHAYLVNQPLRKANLIHNQLNIFNALYEKAFNNVPFSNSVKSEKVPFFTLDEDNELIKYLTYLETAFTGKRIDHIDQLLSQLGDIYTGPSKDPYKLFKNTPGVLRHVDRFNNLRWTIDAMTLKTVRLYLHYATLGGYRAGDVNTDVTLSIDKMINQYRIITDLNIARHLTELALTVASDNTTNMN